MINKNSIEYKLKTAQKKTKFWARGVDIDFIIHKEPENEIEEDETK